MDATLLPPLAHNGALGARILHCSRKLRRKLARSRSKQAPRSLREAVWEAEAVLRQVRAVMGVHPQAESFEGVRRTKAGAGTLS